MCRRVQCGACGKPSFAGCGMHVEQVLSDVPRQERCRCHEASPPRETKTASPTILDRLFGGDAPKPR